MKEQIEEIRKKILSNLDKSDISLAEDGLRIQPDPFSGWCIVVISSDFEGKPQKERKALVLAGLENIQIEWLDLLTPEEREWVGVLPLDGDLEDLPLWPEALARRRLARQLEILFPSDLDEDIPLPITAAFYSLRGGVGRSTALAYAAHILAARGCKVVCVDMDLEAPGLAALFGKEHEIAEDTGLVHLLFAIDNGKQPDISKHLLRISEADDLYCLPAGHIDANYARCLRFLDPSAWYREERNPLRLLMDGLRKELPFTPDVILFDARTGISAFNAPLLFDLADMSVIVFFPHPQTENGTAALTRALLAARTCREFQGRELTPEPRFLVSPVPAGNPEISARYQNRAIEWVADWLSEVKNAGLSFTESEITHSIPYRERIAASDKIFEDKESWRPYQAVAEWIERFIPDEEDRETASLSRLKADILEELRFSHGAAEDQERFLENFVETGVMKKALNLSAPLVLGRKGTGKTAVFRRLHENPQKPSAVVSASAPLKKKHPWLLGQDGFRSIDKTVQEKQITWDQFWGLYSCLACYFDWPFPEKPLPVSEFIDDLSDTPASEREMVKLIQKLLRVEDFPFITNDWLRQLDRTAPEPVFLLLDGLDTGFGGTDEDRKRRRTSLQGLFSFVNELGNQLEKLHVKILLREDIWKTLRFENKSHFFGRSVALKWNEKAVFIKVALKQVMQSERFRDLIPESYKNIPVDDWGEREVFSTWDLLVGERMSGGKTAFTRNWIWNRLADGNHDQTPRHLSQLMHEAAAWEKKTHSKNPYERSIIRPRALIKALPEISTQAVDALQEEFPELQPLWQNLTGHYTPVRSDDLKKIDDALLALAREIGLLDIYEGTEEKVERYKVPDLFVQGLGMTRNGNFGRQRIESKNIEF